MIKSTNLHKEFGREEILARMTNHIAEKHSYNASEFDRFDPLVDLMLKALAKELEKSHIFFKDSFNELITHLADRLLPEANIAFTPSYSILHTNPSDRITVTADNFCCFINKEIGQFSSDINFVPLIPMTVFPAELKMIMTGSKLYAVNGIEKEELVTYKPNNSSIFLGLNIDSYLETDNLRMYFTWFDHPKTKTFFQILKNSKWLVKNVEIKDNHGLKTYFSNESQVKSFWTDDTINQSFESVFKIVEKNYFTLSISELLQESEHIIPDQLKQLINEDPKLSYASNLTWVEIQLPVLEESKELADQIFCQLNCIPVINLNYKKEQVKIRKPYKIIRISGDEYFVGINKIHNHEIGEYLPSHALTKNNKNRVQGFYSIGRNHILRIDKKEASKRIVELVDLIREERNAFASFYPDKIIDELDAIKIHINRIEQRLGESLDIKPNDVFITIQDEDDENLVSIDYWTTHGADANGIVRSNEFEINSEYQFAHSSCINIETTKGGSFSLTDSEKFKRFKSELQNRNRIVTNSDFRAAIEFTALPYAVNSIQIKNGVHCLNGLYAGYVPSVCAEVEIINNHKDDLPLHYIQSKIENYINERAVTGQYFKVNLSVISND